MSFGMRPVAFGLLAGGALGAAAALPVIRDKIEAPDDVEMAREGVSSTLDRRIGGLLGNFALPAAMLLASRHPAVGQAASGALLTAAAAVPGAYWAARTVTDA